MPYKDLTAIANQYYISFSNRKYIGIYAEAFVPIYTHQKAVNKILSIQYHGD